MKTDQQPSTPRRPQVVAVIDNPNEPIIVVVSGTENRTWQVHLDLYDDLDQAARAHFDYALVKPEAAGTWAAAIRGVGAVGAVTAPAELSVPSVRPGRCARTEELLHAALRFVWMHEDHLARLGRR